MTIVEIAFHLDFNADEVREKQTETFLSILQHPYAAAAMYAYVCT